MATTFTVPDGRVAMAATLYTGTGANQSISNAVNTVSFQPDFVWGKNRTSADNHAAYDSVRGVQKRIQPNSTVAEDTSALYLTAFNSNGFSLGTDGQLNNSGSSFVAWNWKAGGTVTAGNNTAGTITSTVSANTTAGFSVVTYTGTGANATVGHGLGIAPSMIIVKQRSAVQSWPVYHVSNGAANVVYLDLTNVTASSTAWQSTTPAATVFSIGTSAATNTNAATYVAYCWAPVAGYSAFGIYAGNGVADGPFIYTGFRPRWLMIKCSNVASTYTSWYMVDTAREPGNISSGTVPDLWANLSVAEGYRGNGVANPDTVNYVDILSNGFKVRAGNADEVNAIPNYTYIYAAFAENPLKYANAR